MKATFLSASIFFFAVSLIGQDFTKLIVFSEYCEGVRRQYKKDSLAVAIYDLNKELLVNAHLIKGKLEIDSFSLGDYSIVYHSLFDQKLRKSFKITEKPLQAISLCMNRYIKTYDFKPSFNELEIGDTIQILFTKYECSEPFVADRIRKKKVALYKRNDQYYLTREINDQKNNEELLISKSDLKEFQLFESQLKALEYSYNTSGRWDVKYERGDVGIEKLRIYTESIQIPSVIKKGL